MPRSAITCLFALCFAFPLAGQAAPKTAKAALAAFAKVRDADEAARTRAVGQLGRFDGAEVEALLVTELGRATTPRYRSAVATALGAKKRPGAAAVLAPLLSPDQSAGGVIYAVARALARQGADGLTALQGGLASTSSVVKAACLSGLSTAGTPEAWDLIADYASEGSAADRRSALTYLARAELTPKVKALLIEGVADADVNTALRCLPPLAKAGWEGAKPATLKVHERSKNTLSATQRPLLLDALIELLPDAQTFDPFLIHIAANDASIEKVFGKLAARAAKSAEFVAWLQKRGLKRKSILERCATLRILTLAEDPSVTETLIKAAKARQPDVVITALRCLGERGDRSAVPTLRKYLRGRGDARRIQALFSLHELLRGETGWGAELLPLLDSKDRELRTAALDILADLGSEEGLDAVLGDLDHKEWPVRAAAFDYCRKVRSVRSIPLLIKRVDRESGRLKEDVLDTLRSLTGFRYSTKRQWDTWWKAEKDGFELIPADAFEKKPKKRGAQRGATITYYDMPLLSDHVCFVVDRSGSMSAQIGTSKNNTRLDEAKRQLKRVVESMPDHYQFNVVWFGSNIDSAFKGITPMKKKNRKKALDVVAETEPGGGTNMHDALEKAFADKDIDTIYLLSDGYPTAGEIIDAQALGDEVSRWNRTRQIRIHCIAIGSTSPLLERIAKDSGGRYAHVR